MIHQKPLPRPPSHYAMTTRRSLSGSKRRPTTRQILTGKGYPTPKFQ